MSAAHTLYTFRRCPYAMRGRMGLSIAGVPVQVREVVLRDKPAEMLEASPKGTVPVLLTSSGDIVDESLDVMRWALAQNDPEGWLDADPDTTHELIARNDGPFKRALDRYKYPNRYSDEDLVPGAARASGLEMLQDLDARITAQGGQLVRAERSLADIAIFPFIRQFAHTDMDWFNAQDLPALQAWLEGHKQSSLFKGVMKKYAQWSPGADEPTLPVAA
ncbi:MAG TPA: glutathione S-transferase [Hyphomonas atlantica]|uniref:Glutathione S-transferase n=1 Tax=Hyphomonas atlantica TaxID=1280948 RepID=A0A356W6T1_9PROT|nr:glutathione S-transferase [Hyphomonas atlantica]